MQKALEAELQGLVAQASSLETQLAAEPAKQRALALQVHGMQLPSSSPKLLAFLMTAATYALLIMHLDLVFACLLCCAQQQALAQILLACTALHGICIIL